MKKAVFVLLMSLFAMATQAQRDTGIGEVLVYAEQLPEFPGGIQALNRFLAQNVRYPQAARENGLQGKVIAEFMVDTSGSISEIHIIQSLSRECDAEVIRIIGLMPKWRPGKINGRPSKMKDTLPVIFKMP